MSEVNDKAEDAAEKAVEKVRSTEKTIAQSTGAAADAAVKEASQVWEKAKDASRQAGTSMSKQYRRLKRGAQDAYTQSRDKSQEWEQSFEGYVRRNPITTVLAGVGVGILVGLALSRKE